MIKVYQIFVDGACGDGWYEVDPNAFKGEITFNHAMEYGSDILPSQLNLILNRIKFMEIGDVLEFERNLKFFCFEIEEEEYKKIKKWQER